MLMGCVVSCARSRRSVSTADISGQDAQGIVRAAKEIPVCIQKV